MPHFLSTYSIRLTDTLSEVLANPAFNAYCTEQLLPAYLVQQRWFTSKGKKMLRCRIVHSFEIRGGFCIVLLAVDYADGSEDMFQLPLAWLTEAGAIAAYEQVYATLVLARFEEPVAALLCDAVGCDDFRRQLFLDIQAETPREDELTYDAGKLLKAYAFDEVMSRLPAIDTSNTAIIYNQTFFFKLFRKVSAGLNPDLELTRYLSEQTNFANSPAYGGSFSVGKMHTQGATAAPSFINLGVMIQNIDNQGDAWSAFCQFAKQTYERVRAVLSQDSELQAPVFVPTNRYEDLQPLEKQLLSDTNYQKASLLGRRTAEMHLALAAATADQPALAPVPIEAQQREAIFLAAKKLVDRQFEELQAKRGQLKPELQQLADAVLGDRRAVMERLAAFKEKQIDTLLTRIHGDYHLGQVLATEDDFYIIDFEGEPLLSIPERQQKRPPFKDVGGMIRSFHYAAQGILFQDPGFSEADRILLRPWGDWWFRQMRHSFLAGYLATAGSAPFVPASASEREDLIDFFVLEKAVYEVAYELNSRPDWLPIPLQGVRFALLDNGGR